MKIQFGFGISVLFILGAILTSSSSAGAITVPKGREAAGIVESVDAATMMLTITVDCEDKDKSRLEVKWGSLTRAFANGRAVTFAELKPGTRVAIRYISPVFGPKVLRRICWIDLQNRA